MDDDVRKAEQWTIRHEIQIGSKEVILGEDPTDPEKPYMVGYCQKKFDGMFEEYTEVLAGDDYLELMGIFLDRCKEQLGNVRAARDELYIPFSVIMPEHCTPVSYKESIEGMVVAINPAVIRAESRRADVQLVLATSGFGAQANSRGTKVYTKSVATGREDVWRREDIMGTVKPEHLPDWAKDKIKLMEAQKDGKNLVKFPNEKEESR